MSDSWSGKADEIKARLKEALGPDREADAEALVERIRDTVAKAGSDVDTDALKARVKDVIDKAEGKVDTEKLKRWVDEADAEKFKGWLDEAKIHGAGAAAMIETQVDKLSERAPGAFDKLLGAAKEKLGSLTGDEDLVRAGELDRLKGQIKESFAETAESVEAEAQKVTDAAEDALGDSGGRS
jgi:uncharacterized protein YjbJ (UPF0337 family)